jgi:hypothetical protein
MPIVIGPGITIGAGLTVGGGFVASVELVYNLDAANYSALPVSGSTVAGTGAYPITVSNTTSRLSWSSANGGIFTMSGAGASTTDTMVGGPNWVTGQSYSVFMAYQATATQAGRLLNTNSEASKDWLMGLYTGNPNAFYPNGTVNLPSTGADLVWHFGWATFNTSTNVGQLWIATNTQPTTFTYTATNAAFGGFNQLRLFSRSGGSEVQTGNVGLVQAYSGIFTTADIQGLYAQYKSRFGY